VVVDKKLFAGDGSPVTRVGLGGEGVLRTYGREQDALAVIEEALVQGINYFDSAKAYAGSESYYGRFWSDRFLERSRIFQTSKSASRDREGARMDLDNTLRVMGLEYLDLWQIHDVRTWDDVQKIEGRGGALEAFLEARDQGLSRFIGVTGHHDPEVLHHCVSFWPVDAVLLPVNPLEAAIGGFIGGVLEQARSRGIAVIGMKVLGGSHYISENAGVTAELLVRFALSQDITTAIVGCSTPGEVAALSAAARDFEPLSEKEEQRLIELFRPYARRLAFYRGVL